MPLGSITVVCPVYAPPKAAAANPPPAGSPQFRPSSRYDAAQTTPDNRNHWANADDLSANASNHPETRRLLRRRARYERQNDPHLDGLVKQLADDLVGTGPRLQLTLGDGHDDDARLVEASFAAWCRAAKVGTKLRILHEARPVDGEGFGLLVTNPALPNPVKLDVRLVEADQVETPLGEGIDPNAVSGIEFDADGNPAFFHVLKQHPGDYGLWNWVGEFDRTPARFVLHWFRPSRAGQARGVCEFASSLPVGAQTRRYSAAVLSAAEFGASISGVLETDAPPADDGTPPATEDWSEVGYTRGTLLTLPGGVKAKGFDAKQPMQNHREYVTSKRGEMGRPVQAPLNLVTGDSSQFNFASGRLDHLPYQRVVWIERERLRAEVLDRLFLAWYAEARLVGLIPDALPAVNEWSWEWGWDAFGQLNPLQEAQASQLRLALYQTTLAEECAANGTDWRQVLQQRAKERAMMAALGLTDVPLPAGENPVPAATDPAEPTPAEGPTRG